MPTLEQLRRDHPHFVFEKVEWECAPVGLVAKLHYRMDPGILFTTTLTFHGVTAPQVFQLDPNIITWWLTNIGMVEGLSYWKAACCPIWQIKAGYFTPDQIAFWEELLAQGMSEFFFINQIDGWQKNFVQFEVLAPHATPPKDRSSHRPDILIPIGGGKDSIVTAEILKKANVPLHTFCINQNDQVRRVLEALKIPSNYRVTRQLDQQLLSLNQQGYLDGHTPFSAMVSFVSTLTAFLWDVQDIALSNEWSANEGNTEFLGQNINHQYSKSFVYEEDVRTYLATYISETVSYFSFLRPLHELQIAELFTLWPEYWPLFLSCNRGQATGHWCGECPKCLFVFTVLSAFLSPEHVSGIFGKNLFEDERLLPILEELAGVRECKSLECVGTRQETLLALSLAVAHYPLEKLPILLTAAQHWTGSKLSNHRAVEAWLQTLQPAHNVPEEFYPLLEDAIEEVARRRHSK